MNLLPIQPAALSMRDFAARLDVAKNTVRKWVDEGMPALRHGLVVRIPIAEAEAWLKASEGAKPQKQIEQVARARRVPKAERVPVYSRVTTSSGEQK